MSEDAAVYEVGRVVDPIATRPHQLALLRCSVCVSKEVAISISGQDMCGECGNQVNLCGACLYRMQGEIDAMGLGNP